MHTPLPPLHRRNFIRGLGAMISLPFLEAMTPFTAVAAQARSKLPLRFIAVGLEGGMWTGEDGLFPWKEGASAERTKEWGRKGVLAGGAIADTGANYRMTSTLKPLEAFRKDLLVLSGLHHPNDAKPNTVVNAHGQDLGTLLTGTNISGTPGVALKNGISFDQHLAAKIGEQTRFPSLELAVGSSSYNTKEATGLGYMGFLSYDADGYAMPVEGDPAAVFDRLFTSGSARDQAARDAQRRRNKSVLDAALDDMKRITGRVAADDRRKLDEYFSTVRELEKRIERAKQWEGIPMKLPPGAKRPEAKKGGAYGNDGSARVEQMRLMLDVLALAMQADVTRVATIKLGGYYGSFGFLGFPEDPHGVYAHNGGDPAKIAGAKAIDRMHMEQFAYLLGKLAEAKEDGGSVLDHSIVLCGAGLSNGPNGRASGNAITFDAHGQHNQPLLIAGRAGGRLKTGQHVNFDHGTRLSNLFVTTQQLMGVNETKFSDATEPLAGLV